MHATNASPQTQEASSRSEIHSSPPAKRRIRVEKDLSKFPEPCAVPDLPLPSHFQARLTPNKEAPWVWASEAAFLRIQESDIVNKGTAMLTYLAHMRISNEVRSHTYRTHSIHLENRAGLKESSVKRCTRELSRIGLLFIHRARIPGTAGHQVHAYTLGTTYQRGVGYSVPDLSGTEHQTPLVRSDPPAPVYTCKNKRNKKHDHVNALVELTAEQEDLIRQINELTESENRTEQFRWLWETRLKEDELAVFQAIGETRCLKREGKIKRTIGGTLGWHYKNFYKGNLARRSEQLKAGKGREGSERYDATQKSKTK